MALILKEKLEEKMKKLLFATGLFITFTWAALNAQTPALTANIPFDFQMGNARMPAGEYTFHRDANSVLTIRAADGRHAAMVLTTPATRRDAPTKPSVQFQRYGDAYFLSGLWTASSTDGFAVPQSSKQKELARRVQHPEKTVIALTK
jgi:hypothetical protein